MNILNKQEQEKIYKDYILEFYKEEIKNHKNGNCNCDLTEGGNGLCQIGQWLEGCITSEDLLRDRELITGEILDSGKIEKEYFRQGYIYKNYPNYWAKKGICYISEFQGEQVAKPILDSNGNIRKDEFGEEMYCDEYYITENAKEGIHFETYASIRKTAYDTLYDNEFNYTNEEEVRIFANELFEMVDWQFASTLANELVESWEE